MAEGVAFSAKLPSISLLGDAVPSRFYPDIIHDGADAFRDNRK
jgi:hypothetical protein